MSKLIAYRERMKAIADDMGPLAQKDERSADEETRLDALIAEFNDLGEKATREANIEATLATANGQQESNGRVGGKAPRGEQRDRDEPKRDLRSIGRRFVESDQFTTYQKNLGKRSAPVEVGSFYRKHQVTHTDDTGPDELRALVYGGAMPASLIEPQIIPGFYRPDDLMGSLRDVLINGTTNSDAITFFRELVATNAAAGVAEATATTGATGLKPESGITFEEETASVKLVATWIPITRQLIWDAGQMQTYIQDRLFDFLRLEESNQLLNGAGGADLTGILQTTGIQFLDNTVTTGYWAVNPLASVGTDRENFDRILHAKTVGRTVGRARPNFAVLNPEDLEQYLMRVDGNFRYYGGGPFAGTEIPRMWGLRIVEDENIAAGNALVGDGRMAAVWDRMQAQLLIDTIDDQFVRNMLTLLAEQRLALTVFRPAAFLHVELAAW